VGGITNIVSERLDRFVVGWRVARPSRHAPAYLVWENPQICIFIPFSEMSREIKEKMFQEIDRKEIGTLLVVGTPTVEMRKSQE
jgi:hypothetical protein